MYEFIIKRRAHIKRRALSNTLKNTRKHSFICFGVVDTWCNTLLILFGILIVSKLVWHVQLPTEERTSLDEEKGWVAWLCVSIFARMKIFCYISAQLLNLKISSCSKTLNLSTYNFFVMNNYLVNFELKKRQLKLYTFRIKYNVAWNIFLDVECMHY